MRFIWNVLFLFLLGCAVEAGFVIAYQRAAEGHLASAIAAHTATFRSETIPSADKIDLVHDDWVQVAHFENTFYKIQFFVDIIMSLIFGWVLIMGGVSAAIARRVRVLQPNVHFSRGLYLIIFSILLSGLMLPTLVSGYLIGQLRGTELITLITSDMVMLIFLIVLQN